MDIDDLINGLPTRPLPGPSPARRKKGKSKRASIPAPRPASRPTLRPASRPALRPVPRPPPPGAQRKKYFRVPRWLLWVMMLYIVGSVYAMHLAERGPGNPARPERSSVATSQAEPGSTVTVTVAKTVTVTVLPESCKRAVALMRSVIEDINQLNSKSAEQLDIASDANQAIFQRDWAKLGEVQERQRILAHEHEGAYQDFKSKYKPLLDALAQCERDAK